MGAALVHLLAEAHEHLTEALGPPKQGEEVYPWAMVLMGVGFVTTLIPAQLLEPPAESRQCPECTSDDEALAVTPGAGLLSKGLSGGFESHSWHHQNHTDFSHARVVDGHSHHNHHNISDGHRHGHHQTATEESSDLEAPLLVRAPSGEPGAVLTALKNGMRSNTTQASSMMLTVGLVIHSALEGAAIGAQNDVGASVSVAVAVLAHKGLAGYAIGSSLVSCSGVSLRQFVLYLSLFATATPIGILLGAWLSISVEDTFWAAAISAVSSGTFLYAAVVEVLGNELRQECFEADSPHRTVPIKVCKFSCFIAGFAAMAIVSKYT